MDKINWWLSLQSFNFENVNLLTVFLWTNFLVVEYCWCCQGSKLVSSWYRQVLCSFPDFGPTCSALSPRHHKHIILVVHPSAGGVDALLGAICPWDASDSGTGATVGAPSSHLLDCGWALSVAVPSHRADHVLGMPSPSATWCPQTCSTKCTPRIYKTLCIEHPQSAFCIHYLWVLACFCQGWIFSCEYSSLTNKYSEMMCWVWSRARYLGQKL